MAIADTWHSICADSMPSLHYTDSLCHPNKPAIVDSNFAARCELPGELDGAYLAFNSYYPQNRKYRTYFTKSPEGLSHDHR